MQYLTEEHKEKIRLSNLGKAHKPGRWTKEARLRHSKMMRGRKLRPWTDAEKAAQSIRIAKAWTPEKRLKQSKLKMGSTIKPWTKARKKRHSIICTGRKLSLETRLKKSGVNHPFWKGGMEPLTKLIRQLPEMRMWVLQVFKKDHYTCQKCLIVGGNLKAHHKEAFSLLMQKFLSLYSQFSPFEDRSILIRLALGFIKFWDIDNGGTLCQKCHLEFHHLYGCDGNNTKRQWDDFIMKTKNQRETKLCLS